MTEKDLTYKTKKSKHTLSEVEKHIPLKFYGNVVVYYENGKITFFKKTEVVKL